MLSLRARADRKPAPSSGRPSAARSWLERLCDAAWRLIRPAALALLLAGPAASQEAADRPVFKQPPVDGTVSGTLGCISQPYVEEGGVLRQVRRDPPLPYVPEEMRISGSASATVTREALRTLLHLRLTASGDSVPAVAERLSAARTSLASAIAQAGQRPLSFTLLDARIARPQRHPDGSLAGEIRLAVLLPGRLTRPDALGLIAPVPSARLEGISFDYPVPEAIAEDLRPELERRALDDAADRAVAKGVVLAELLDSDLRIEGGQAAAASLATESLGTAEFSVTARMIYRMAPAPVAGGE